MTRITFSPLRFTQVRLKYAVSGNVLKIGPFWGEFDEMEFSSDSLRKDGRGTRAERLTSD